MLALLRKLTLIPLLTAGIQLNCLFALGLEGGKGVHTPNLFVAV